MASPPLPLTIAIPMLGRAAEVERLVANAEAATATPYELLFIVSPTDEAVRGAVEDAGLEPLVVPWEPERADYARKINHAFAETTAPWFFMGASDITFGPGWDTVAINYGERTGAGVIGTNDMASPYVRSGKGATHILIRRAYIEEFGSGTFDRSGLVLCEQYDHQYVDNELVETAKIRGRWVFARGSKVKHAHPHWKTAEMDETYEKAFRETREDRSLHFMRMKKIKVWGQTRGRRNVRP